MFSNGDVVVYRHHVCEVASVREAYYEGKDYLELHALFENSLKLFVSVEDAKTPTLRPIMTRQEALELIDSIHDVNVIDENALHSKDDTPTLRERHMKEEYDKRLKTFAPEDLIPIMKSVHQRTKKREDAGRHITATDKKYLDLAENLLCDELSLSLDIPRDQVKDFLVERIEQGEAKTGQAEAKKRTIGLRKNKAKAEAAR